MTRPSIFVTRRWPSPAEEALSALFDVTFNADDWPLSKDELMAGVASHDMAAPTVSDVIDADVVAAGAAGRCRMDPFRPKTPILAPGRNDRLIFFRTSLPPGHALLKRFIT